MSETPSSPLHAAAASGDIDALNRLLEDGADIDARDDTGRTPLFCAARNSELIAARHLLKRGARVDCATDMATTALVTAARGGHAEMARLLMANGADPNQIVQPRPAVLTPAETEAMQNFHKQFKLPEPTEAEAEESRQALEGPRKSNSLAAAIMSRDTDTITALLEGGADVNNASGPSGVSPLSAAIAFAEPAVISLLIQHGADVNSGGSRGTRVLTAAVMKQRIDSVRILLEAGADPNSGDGTSPLVFAIQFNNLPMIKLLLEFGASIERDSTGVSMPMAMARNKPEILEIFARHRKTDWHKQVADGNLAAVVARLDSGATIDVRDDSGKTALMIAAQAGHADLAENLLERGAAPDAGDNVQRTALMHAVQKGHGNVVRALLGHGANVNATNKWGQTALTSALSEEKRETRELLIDAGATIGIVEAAQIGDNAQVMAFLADGVSVNEANSAGTTALMAAAARGDIELATVLHDRGADVSPTDTLERDAFHLAVQHASASGGDTALLALLLEWGADINKVGTVGSSALSTPVFAGSEGVMRFLLDNGADPNGPPNTLGWPLLHNAILFGKGKLAPVKILLEYGADVDGANKEGSTALMEALGLLESKTDTGIDAAEYKSTLVKLLIEIGANVNAENRHGTVLDRAIATGDVELVRLLLDAGADVKNIGGLRVMVRSSGRPSAEMRALLRESGAEIPEPIEPPAGLPEGFAESMAEGKMPPDFMSKMLDEMNKRRKQKNS